MKCGKHVCSKQSRSLRVLLIEQYDSKEQSQCGNQDNTSEESVSYEKTAANL